MKVTSDQAPEPVVEPQSAAKTSATEQRVSTESNTASAVEQNSAAAQTAIVTPAQRETDVTFRRDANGQIYYVVSDAQSGQEILEIPQKTVREVGQGIEDYLKQAQAKASAHVKVKA
jgi:uncharacterized FlaG/YvyC family protein